MQRVIFCVGCLHSFVVINIGYLSVDSKFVDVRRDLEFLSTCSLYSTEMRNVADYLSKKKSGANAELWRELEDLYNRKLWHQLTVKLKVRIYTYLIINLLVHSNAIV